ncbi:hypothetical protein V8E36_008545 [Tilletia maclaganii]
MMNHDMNAGSPRARRRRCIAFLLMPPAGRTHHVEPRAKLQAASRSPSSHRTRPASATARLELLRSLPTSASRPSPTASASKPELSISPRRTADLPLFSWLASLALTFERTTNIARGQDIERETPAVHEESDGGSDRRPDLRVLCADRLHISPFCSQQWRPVTGAPLPPFPPPPCRLSSRAETDSSALADRSGVSECVLSSRPNSSQKAELDLLPTEVKIAIAGGGREGDRLWSFFSSSRPRLTASAVADRPHETVCRRHVGHFGK